MVKSAPMRDHSIVIKPRRRASRAIGVCIVVALLGGAALMGLAFFAPARLTLAQAHVVGVFHGGVAGSEERTFIDACVDDREGTPLAVTRTIRTVTFNDGASIGVIFSSRPTATNSQCIQ